MTEEFESDRPTMTPFLAALAIIVVVVIGVWVSSLFQGDGPTEEQRVGLAAVGQNDAMQRQNFTDFTEYTCSRLRGTEAEFLARQQDSASRQGARYVDDVTAVHIDGDRATGTVTSHFENAPEDKTNTETTFVREDGRWRVCSGVGDSRP